MQQSEEGPPGHKLCDNAEVWGLRASTHEQDHIWVLQALHDAHFSLEFLHKEHAAP